MAASTLSDIFSIPHILFTKVSTATKVILAQLGSNEGQGQSDVDNAQWWQHVGFASRPAKANRGKEAAEAFVVRGGGVDAVIASRDLRGLSIYGNLADGETCVYATGATGAAQARVLLKADGSINLFTSEGNASGGKGMGVFIRTDGSIDIASSKGNAVMLGNDGAVKVFNGSGSIQIKPDGHIKVAAGSKLEMVGSSVCVGGPAALPIALAPHVLSALTAIQTECAAIAAALVAVCNIAPLTPAHVTAANAATTAVGVAAAALAALATQIPSLRTSSD